MLTHRHGADGGWLTDRQTERRRVREKREEAAMGKFKTVDSYHQTSLQAAFVCVSVQEMNHSYPAKPVLVVHAG